MDLKIQDGWAIALRLENPKKPGKYFRFYAIGKPATGRPIEEINRESRMRENLTYGIDEGLWET